MLRLILPFFLGTALGLSVYGACSVEHMAHRAEFFSAGPHQAILDAILELRFSSADSLMDAERNADSTEVPLAYLENYLEFMEALIGGERKVFDQYLRSSGPRLETLLAADRIGALCDISTIHLQSAVLCAYHGENFRAARHLYRARRYLKHCENKDPGNPGKFRNRGIITLVGGSAPEEFRWILKAFGIQGGIEEGLGYLGEYRDFTVGAEKTEACLLIDFARIGLQTGSGKKGRAESPDEDTLTLHRYALALEALRGGNSDCTRKLLEGFAQDRTERPLPYLDLLLGEAMLNGLDTMAARSLRAFLDANRGPHYRHHAWHKLSWCFALSGDTVSYESARGKVLGLEEPYLDADRQAHREASDSLPLNTGLLKARLLFDGGYYRPALDLLADSSGMRLLNKKDTLEFLYRQGRILEKLGETGKSLDFYTEVVQEGARESWYFAPNAALHMGMIHEQEERYDMALENYRNCLKINKSAYKRSIDYKARQGMQRVEELQKLR
jgi:tetratricopeptide (TPR) repeat protein